MSGADDRSPGGIEEMALGWGVSAEQARRIAATAAALAAGTCPEDDLPTGLPNGPVRPGGDPA